MSEDTSIRIEFFGGPKDGQQMLIPERKSELLVWEQLPNYSVAEHIYQARIINGIFVRLPSGLYPYDWKCRV